MVHREAELDYVYYLPGHQYYAYLLRKVKEGEHGGRSVYHSIREYLKVKVRSDPYSAIVDAAYFFAAWEGNKIEYNDWHHIAAAIRAYWMEVGMELQIYLMLGDMEHVLHLLKRMDGRRWV